MRELPPRIDLLILELIVVEADALQVQNEVVGETGDEAAFGRITLLVAVVALVVRDNFASDELLEAVLDGLLALDLQGKTEEVFMALNDVLAGTADELIAVASAIDVVCQMAEGRWLEALLDLVE